MKTPHSDDLLRLAFGELSEDAAAQVREAAAGPELARAAALRAALSELRSIPDHQLSTERLRTRLLRDGLDRRRSGSRRSGLAYAAFALAAFAGAAFFAPGIRAALSPRPAAIRVIDAPAAPIALAPKSDTFGIEAATPSKDASPAPRAGFAKSRLVAFADRRIHLVRGIVNAVASESRRTKLPPDLVATNLGGQSPAAAATGGGAAQPSGPHDTILHIDAGTDSQTGLPTAREVSSSNDELVGG